MRIVSNETRDKLKKMGLSQKTMFVWCTVLDETWIEPRKNVPNIHDDGLMIEPIYDLSFLVEALPAVINMNGESFILTMQKNFTDYTFFYDNQRPSSKVKFLYPNPAEAAAQLLIYIVEQGYAEIKNGKVVAV